MSIFICPISCLVSLSIARFLRISATSLLSSFWNTQEAHLCIKRNKVYLQRFENENKEGDRVPDGQQNVRPNLVQNFATATPWSVEVTPALPRSLSAKARPQPPSLCHFDPGLLLLVEDPVVPLLPDSPSYQGCNGVESSSLSFGNLHSLVTKP